MIRTEDCGSCGAAMLAVRTGATILPVAYCGTRRVLRSPQIWFPRVDIKINKPYTPVLPEEVSRKVELKLITEDIMTRIGEMLPKEQRGIYRKKLLGWVVT